ncbi:hypothetical protein ACFOWE_28210 [Planomonospora corallina]|uniref:Uncharacterized protein n=1 Tax=Planomonospora corallina TaxID=1806052 RepID=A0ABV8IFC9_9ACTN
MRAQQRGEPVRRNEKRELHRTYSENLASSGFYPFGVVMDNFFTSFLSKAAVIVLEVLTMRLVEALVTAVMRRLGSRPA